ncbi:40S ribosomal protein S12 [Musa troglodytarum]|uniref:40S ribosomal protein S12 n=1 Tax=Musa troglodytarum TaxID=320322 RepID=A0A9E7JGF0_9LILI|nr:40S ribosomal protein S12 [Musa troglodytarum]
MRDCLTFFLYVTRPKSDPIDQGSSEPKLQLVRIIRPHKDHCVRANHLPIDLCKPLQPRLSPRDPETLILQPTHVEVVCQEMAAEEPEKTAPALGEPMDLMTALQLVMKKSLAHDGLVRGLHEAAKAIEKHAAQLCILAEDCNQAEYVKLVKALCADHNVHLVTVPSAKTLGEWAGDYGEESEGLHIVQEYVKSHWVGIDLMWVVGSLYGSQLTDHLMQMH